MPAAPAPHRRTLAAPWLALLAGLALAACKRDLEVPAGKSFSATAASEALAPRDTTTLTAVSGTPPYRWTFPDGGRLSGDDASVDPTGQTVTYRAGSSGSAQDVVEVRDAAGTAARVRITVGAPLTVTPASLLVAPGGHQTFQVTGGKKRPGGNCAATPCYNFAFVTPVGTSYAPASDPASGPDASLFKRVDGTSAADYTAGSRGDVFDYLAVSDFVVPPTTVVVAIRITSPLQIFPRALTAAPNEVLSFTAFGGQPPYVYSPIPRSGGVMVDANAGVYRLGPDGPPASDPTFVDTIVVSDANGRVATATVVVTPPLAADLASTDVRGGSPLPILVTGGKAPYGFRFAARGNRSHGTLDAIGGLYTPGPSPGAQDVLVVTDETGTTVTITPPPVGPLRLSPGGGVNRCVTGDFDGNSISDVAFLHQRMKLTEVTGVGSASQLSRTYFVGDDFAFPPTWTPDQDRDGRTELLMLGSRQGAPSDVALNGPATYWGLVPATDGVLSVVGQLRWAQTPFGARLGTHVLLEHASTDVALFAASCGTGLMEYRFSPGDYLASGSSCVRVDGPGEYHDPDNGTTRIVALTAPDLDGDAGGLRDLAWLLAAPGSEDSAGPVYVRYGSTTGLLAGELIRFVAQAGSTAVPLPAGTYFQSAGDGDQRRIVTFPLNRAGFPSGLLLRLASTTTGRGSLWILRGRPATWTQLPDLLPAGGSGADGATLLPEIVPGIQNLAAWSQDGDVVTFQVLSNLQLMQESRSYRGVVAPGTGQRYAGKLLQAGFPVTGACVADVTGDGAADLVLAGQSVTSADVLYGADGLEFATRPHLRGMSWPAAMGDFDGDGIGDVVASEEGLGLSILYGTEDQLAWSERVSTGPASLVAAGPYAAGGRGDSVIYRTTAGGFRLVRSGAAGFDPPQAVTATKPDGSAITASFAPLMSNASLGGPDTGPDLLTWETSHFGQAWAHVLWREGGKIVDLRSEVVGLTPAFGDMKVSDCWFLPVGAEDGRTSWGANEEHPGVAVAGLCNFQDPSNGNWARIIRWVGAKVVGSGATLRLSAWTVSSPLTGEANAEARVAPLGTVGGRALFAIWADTTANGTADGLKIVALGGPGAAANPATWGTAVPTAPVAFTFARTWTPFFGAVGDLDGDGVMDAVVQTKEGRLLVVKNRGTDAAPDWGFQDNAALWPDTVHGIGLGGGGLPLGVRPSRWLIPPAPGFAGVLDLPSVMTFVGDFDNLGVASEIVPFVHRGHEDGTQGLE